MLTTIAYILIYNFGGDPHWTIYILPALTDVWAVGIVANVSTKRESEEPPSGE